MSEIDTRNTADYHMIKEKIDQLSPKADYDSVGELKSLIDSWFSRLWLRKNNLSE